MVGKATIINDKVYFIADVTLSIFLLCSPAVLQPNRPLTADDGCSCHSGGGVLGFVQPFWVSFRHSYREKYGGDFSSPIVFLPMILLLTAVCESSMEATNYPQFFGVLWLAFLHVAVFLLLIGTAEGGIKAWNVDAKTFVCDLSTTTASVVDLKCNPVGPIFVSAAALQGPVSKFSHILFTLMSSALRVYV
ncbi:hypothetical protein M8C21_031445 [Ambrosia artemisiifolia]|uniref:Uncharacterized protein n=1 Tax=Ambrosia artemisiifolia TaxID=4212 RepID=A0AAD5GVK6_AMBAR|nr:hypothetical protein M8C21_031445 [Ambrosia artemisiifolia]